MDLIHLMRAFFWPGEAPVRAAVWRPAADVYRTRRGWLVKLDLAGVRPEDVAITAQGQRLIVRGRRRDCLREEGCNQYRLEIAYSYFERSLDLPCNLQHADLVTDYRDGMLLVHLDMENEP